MVRKTPQTRVLFSRCRRAAKLAVFGVFLLSGVITGVIGLTRPEPAVAAPNSALNFQARLQTSAGAIVPDGYYNIEFKLYSAASGGSALWTETWYDSNGATAGNDNRVRVKNGYLSASLGSLTAFPGSINWSEELWVTMNVGGSTQTASVTWDGEMNPRLKLTAVPYAFKAGDSNTLDGLDSTAFAAASGSGNYIQNGTSPQTANFNITGNGTIGGNLTLNGNANLIKPASNSTTAFQIQPSSSTTPVLNVDTTNSRVGLGLAAPSYVLDVVGDINTSTGFRVGGTAGATTTCTGGQFLQNATVVGGIVTGGACTAASNGVTTVGTFSNTSIANGASISGNTITFGAADATNPGMVSTGTQTFAGDKTFSGGLTVSGNILQSGTSTFTTGSGAVSLNGDVTLGSGKTLTASGNITTTADIKGRAVTSTGYLTTSTSSTLAGQYTKLATCTISAQFQECRANALILGHENGAGTSEYRATVDWRVKQQAAMGSAPGVGLDVYNVNGITDTDFTAVIVTNTVGSTVVELWGQIDLTFTTWSVNPSVNLNTRAVFHATQGFSASLPAGTQTVGTYADEKVSSLTSGGNITGTTINATTGFQANGVSGANATCSGGQFLQNATVAGGIITAVTCTAASNGVTTVGTLDSQTKSANGAVIAGTTVYFQTADTSNPGMVSTGTQSFAGDKTFTGNTTIGDASSDRLTLNAHLLGGSPIVFQGATDNGFATTIAVTDPTANNTITLPNASGTVAVSATGNIALSSAGQISLTGTVGVANGGTGSTSASYTTNGVMYYNGTNLVTTGAGSTDQCLKSTTGSAPTWGTCGTATTLQDAYTNSGTTNPQITLNSTNGGIKIRDGSTGVTGNLFQIQNNAGTTTLFGISATAMTLQNSSGNALTFDSSTNRLRIYNPSDVSKYAELYYDNAASEAVFAASSGTTRIGNGSGNIILQMSTAADVLQATKSASLSGAYTANDFTFSRTIGASSNSLGGAVVKIESNSTGTNQSTNLLVLNEASTGSTGNLILATTGGSTEQFKVTNTGATTVGGLLTAGAGLTVSGGVANINTSGSSGVNIGTGSSTGTVTIGNQSGGNNVVINANNFTVDATGNFAGVDNLIMGGKLNADVSDANGLRVRNSTGAIGLLNIDSTGSGTTGLSLQIGSATTDANAVELVLDSYNGASDPTGVNGAMYYNTSMNKFRCYQAGQWYDCLGLNPDYNRVRPIYSTDFLDNGANSSGVFWTGSTLAVTAGGSISSLVSGSDSTNNPGVIRIDSSGATNAGYRYGGATTMTLYGGETFEVIFQQRASNSLMRMGFLDSGAGTSATPSSLLPDDGAIIEVNNTTVSGKTYASASTSTTGTTYTLTTNTWYRARVVVNSNATSISFALYNMSGTQLWTNSLTTNIPTATTGSGVQVSATNSTSGTLAQLDYMSLWWDKDLAR